MYMLIIYRTFFAPPQTARSICIADRITNGVAHGITYGQCSPSTRVVGVGKGRLVGVLCPYMYMLIIHRTLFTPPQTARSNCIADRITYG
jgi:hypothetical protein